MILCRDFTALPFLVGREVVTLTEAWYNGVRVQFFVLNSFMTNKYTYGMIIPPLNCSSNSLFESVRTFLSVFTRALTYRLASGRGLQGYFPPVQAKFKSWRKDRMDFLFLARGQGLHFQERFCHGWTERWFLFVGVAQLFRSKKKYVAF